VTPKEEKQYKKLDALLLAYGLDQISGSSFWQSMERENFGQPHIDWYLKEHYRRLDNGRQEDGTKGSRATSYARASRGGEQGQGQQDRAAQGQGRYRQAPEPQRQQAGPMKLSPEWEAKAIKIGEARNAYAKSRRLERYGNDGGPSDLIFDIRGAIAEAGVAKHYKQPWHANVGVLTGVDVGEIIEVRSRKHGGDHNIRPHDKRELPHVVVWVYDDYSYDIRGWLFAYEGMRNKTVEDHWFEKNQCWYVPPPFRPLEELAELLKNESEVARIKASLA
jgi:hypothetical protein